MVRLSMHDVVPLRLASLTFPEWHPLRGQTGDVYAFVIRHASGLLLFETGVGRGNTFLDELYSIRHESIEQALAVHGHDITDIRAVVNSHLHFDHCGNNSCFPGIPIYAQTNEYRAIREPHYTVPEWVDFDDAEYAVIDGDAQIARGVHIVSTPGHSPGHQSLLLDTVEGPVVLAGQAIYSRTEYQHVRTTGRLLEDDPPPDPAQYLASATKLIQLQPRRVHFSHDRDVWEPAHSVTLR